MSKLINPTLKAKRQAFSDFLENSAPFLGEEATEALNDLVHATTETGKAGSITLTIKMKPIGGKAGQMELDTDVKAKLPTPTKGRTILFTTPDNNLQRTDPRQQTLDGVRDVAQESTAQQELRQAPAAEQPAGLRVVGQN